MWRNVLIIALLASALSCLLGVWIGSSAVLAAPIEPVVDQTPQAIKGGTEDIKQFFKSMAFTAEFRVLAAVRDEALGRRYYHVKISPGAVHSLRQQLGTKWIEGRFNRTVHENTLLARVKRSRNLPKWWNLSDPPKADHLMLDHGGTANWYVVVSESGDTCLMWTGH